MGGVKILSAVPPSSLLAVLAAAFLSAGCGWPLEPTVPVGGPQRVDEGQLLFVLPAEVAEAGSQRSVREHRQAALDRDQKVRKAEVILRRHVITGLTAIEVLWIFEQHPTRVRDHGPPGGHTWYWDPSRYWVRFDEMGLAIQGGRF